MGVYHGGAERIQAEGLLPTLAEVLNGVSVGGSIGSGGSSNGTPRRKSAISTAASGNNRLAQPKRDRKRSMGSIQVSGIASRATAGSTESLASSRSSATPNTTSNLTGGQIGPGRRPKPTTCPTHLASTMLKPIRVGLTRHVDRMMLDYGLPLRPNWATPRVMGKYDELRALMAQLADAKRALEAIEAAQQLQPPAM